MNKKNNTFKNKISDQNKSFGICIGASTVSYVILNYKNGNAEMESFQSIAHQGNPKEVITNLFKGKIPDKITITGKKIRNYINLTAISEAEAVEQTCNYFNFSSDIIISAGGENFIVYTLDKNKKISKVLTGNKCASGTGEFYLQQLKRMDLDIDKAASFSETNSPYNISGRCSVFCKSDCTHALNKGVDKGSVVEGLSRMMASKIIELTSRIPHKNALIIGGTSKNSGMIKYLKTHFEEIIIPDQAAYFEAYGAALFALQNKTLPLNISTLFKTETSAFEFHDELKNHIPKVHFKDTPRGKVKENDKCILGLDVGSTTTKAVLLRQNDNLIIASEYLRTNGDPIKASVECYKSLKTQITVPINITGLGVTGSGRQIAGLHALTKGIINEIIAHATATVFFDPEVDTIFEIGGQDAKYTYITSGIASDYAMNEACSAGTGSFLEEAAKESLNIDYLEIGKIALESKRPPNFNDQCSAFISSDIKNAFQEGLSKEDIIAGLVYSVCLNFINRVKGNRPVGKKVFMQGGVCYNKAVPIAMAALTGKEIIVPPDPGLMGAFGVALEIKNRIDIGLIQEEKFNLDDLIKRKVTYEEPFVCYGGREHCDRKCNISMISIEGKKYPFGGACNKYYNLQVDVKKDAVERDYVKIRQSLVFEKYIHPKSLKPDAKTIGIPKSFLTNTLYPLYYNFFSQLGYKIILGDVAKPGGTDKKEAPFCYPVELAHGFFQDLTDKKPDYIFIPHITHILTSDKNENKKVCPFVQSESYFMKTTFKKELKGIKFLSPVLDFSKSYESQKSVFIKLAGTLGHNVNTATKAFEYASSELKKMFAEFRTLGKEALNDLEKDKNKIAMVLFGRVYNSFAKEANMGIPQKFNSRNISIIPHDFLPSEDFESYENMYWGSGQQILKAARFIKNHDQLFGTFVTNFSCGPDAFIVGYFRNIMGMKPSLTIELDSHSADAGINTRIEAALDIIRSYRELNKKGFIIKPESNYKPLQIIKNENIIDSYGQVFSIKDKSVKLIVPSMGRFNSEIMASSFRFMGFNANATPPTDTKTLVAGRGNTSCKECIPLILTAGGLVQYYENMKPDEKVLFFIPDSDGPCRFGQYEIFLKDLIRKREMKNIGIFTLNENGSYGNLGNVFVKRAWTGLTIAGVMLNIQNTIQALAIDKIKATEIFENEWRKIRRSIEIDPYKKIYKQLEESTAELSKIKTKIPIADAKKIALIGENYVRNDDFSKMDLIKKLAEKEFVVKVAPIGEFVYYTNYLASKETRYFSRNFSKKVGFDIRDLVQIKIEKKIKKILCTTGLVDYDIVKIEEFIRKAGHLVKSDLEGETILTIGAALHEIYDHVCGVISIGPFGCMPSRIAESILNVEMNSHGKARSENIHLNSDHDFENYPFLSIETDGNIYPQIIQSKIEIFMLQAERMHKNFVHRPVKMFKKRISKYLPIEA